MGQHGAGGWGTSSPGKILLQEQLHRPCAALVDADTDGNQTPAVVAVSAAVCAGHRRRPPAPAVRAPVEQPSSVVTDKGTVSQIVPRVPQRKKKQSPHDTDTRGWNMDSSSMLESIPGEGTM